MADAFRELDKTLGAYYKQLKKDDYFDADGKGKFLLYCEDNGFEADDIDDEFQGEAGDCMYVEFDPDDFPLANAIEDDDERSAAIFAIIKYCYDNKKAPAAGDDDDVKYADDGKSPYEIELKTDDKLQKECSNKYLKQCGIIYKEEDTLKKCFAIGYKNQYPFLIYLVDSFMRDKMAHNKKTGKDLTMQEWKAKSPYMKHVEKQKKQTAEILSSGVETFIKRGCPAWQFEQTVFTKISDNLLNILQYMLIGSDFVQYLLQEKGRLPFQFDMVIAVRGTRSNMGQSKVDLSDDDSDGSTESSDEDDDPMIANQAAAADIGSISEKMKDNNLPFHQVKMDVGNLQDNVQVTRKLGQEWNKFRDIINKTKKYSKDKNAAKNYPQKRRFCAFVDRRGDEKTDEFTFYEPPAACADFPKDHVPEWYFNSAKHCIIPPKGGKFGDVDAQDVIKADSGMNGNLMTFSFHVEQEDEIRCYLYWNGRYTRVYPQDLNMVLGKVFDELYQDNQKVLDNDKAKDAIYSQLKFTDNKFVSFYRQVSAEKKESSEFPKKY